MSFGVFALEVQEKGNSPLEKAIAKSITTDFFPCDYWSFTPLVSLIRTILSQTTHANNQS